MIRLLSGDCRDVLATLSADSVQCVVTSPPYYGLRDYGTAQWDGGDAACDHAAKPAKRGKAEYTNGQGGSFASNLQAWGDRDVSTVYRDTCGKCGAVRVDRQIGLEATPDAYLATMVAVFREVRRVMRPDATCWINLGDSYSGSWGNQGRKAERGTQRAINGPMMQVTDDGRYPATDSNTGKCPPGYKPKDLLMMPARLALALQADGWWIRSDIIWHKPNPMPESCRDRPTSAHEHVFLITKSSRYYYDADAVRERVGEETRRTTEFRGESSPYKDHQSERNSNNVETYAPRGAPSLAGRNLRNVWTIATAPFPGSHFATMPAAVVERCIKAGSRLGDTVLDPFAGAGTTLLVADRLQRDAIGIELNTAYTEMAMQRCVDDAPLFVDVPAADPEDERMADLFAEAAE